MASMYGAWNVAKMKVPTNYTAYNIPVYGNMRRAQESARYVADIQKNTGRSVKYPGLVYNMAGLAGVREAFGLANGLGKTSRMM